MKIHRLLEVRRGTVFWALETAMCHPETKTIPSGDTGPLAGGLNRWTPLLLTARSRRRQLSLYILKMCLFSITLHFFSGRNVRSDVFFKLCCEKPVLKYAVGDLLMHNILYEDRYKCFTWEHKLGLSCWCMLLVLTGLFQLYSSHMKCPRHDWGYIILEGKMTCCRMSFFTPSNEKHTRTRTIKVLIWQSWMSSLTCGTAWRTTVLSIGKCHSN